MDSEDITQMPAYVYEALDLSTNSIRLFKISPADHHEEVVSGQLVTVCRSSVGDSKDEIQYRALSYEWGPENEDDMPIVIDGRVLFIRRNLHNFLKLYRSVVYAKDHPHKQTPAFSLQKNAPLEATWPLRTHLDYIWIDQICLNQAHLHERNHQVKFMHQIYKQATEVIAYLADEACENALQNHLALLSGRQATFSGSTNEVQFTRELVYAAVAAQSYRYSFDLLSCLSRASYWRRLWIQQELFLA